MRKRYFAANRISSVSDKGFQVICSAEKKA